MRILMAIAAGLLAVTVLAPAADACSSRGRYCDRPYWAANAFEGASGSAPRFAILPGTAQSPRKSR